MPMLNELLSKGRMYITKRALDVSCYTTDSMPCKIMHKKMGNLLHLITVCVLVPYATGRLRSSCGREVALLDFFSILSFL